jgi:membrane associated rhomboid family serine protease
MIPIKDENPARTTPYVVYALIIINVIVYLIDWLGTHVVPPGVQVSGLWNYTLIPKAVWTDQNVNAQLGQNLYIQHISPFSPRITILTSMFMHGGLLHLGGNMLYLWIFGNNIEDTLGHIKFILFYLIGGALAAGAHILSNPNSQVPTLGASGAIAAVLGAYLVLYPTSRVITLVFLGFFVTTVAVPAVVVLGLWIGLQFLSAAISPPTSGGVAYWAHIGGFIAGMIGILLLGGQRLVRGRMQPYYRRDWYEE